MRKTLVQALLVAFCAMLEGCCMNTRKQFLRDGFGLAAILSAQSAPAILVRSMVAARHGIAVAKRGWINPYITDGLTVMWDGEWNAAGGVHDAAATSWKDLSGNGYDIPISSQTVTDNGVRFSNTVLKTFDHTFFQGHAITLHAVIDRTETTGNFCILGFGYSSNRIFVGNKTQYGARFGSSYQNLNVSGTLNSISMTRSDGASNGMIFNGTTSVGSIGSLSLSVDSSTININGENNYGNYRNIFTAHHIAIYSRALTADEIESNYAIDKARFNLA